jgi:hypothetical protein
MEGVAATFPRLYFTDSNGKPLVGGKLYSYLSGTTTPTPTWTDESLQTPNTNPIILDSSGSCLCWLDSTIQYKFVLTNSVNALVWSQDNITGDSPSPSIALSAAVLSVYQGASATDPATRVGGEQLQNGDLYFNTSINAMKAYANGVWYTTATLGATDAALVSFTQLGAGAVTTNVQTKLRESVSVKDFGAVGDGVTNDTAAIQAAIDAVPNGSQIFIPPGVYSVSYGVLNFTRRESITFTSGSSRDSAVLQANAVAASASTPLVDISGCYQLVFEGISFKGVTASGIGAYIHRPLTGADKVSTGIQFYNCQFSQFNVGAQIGRLDLLESNNEDIHFNNCEFRFCTIGYRQYYQNALQNSLTNPYMINNGTCIHLGGNGFQTGSLLVTNANFAVTAVADIFFELPCYLEINQCRSENSPQFIKSSTAFRSTAFPQITLIGVTIIAQTSAVLPMIDCRTMGFIAIGCQFGQPVVDSPAFINLSTYLQKATFVGCSFNVPITYGINTSTWTGTIYTLGGNDGVGQFLLSGCYEYSASLGGYVPVADVNFVDTGRYSITTATPDVTQSNVWLVNNQTAPLTITAFTAFQNQKFSIANFFQSNQTTTIKNNTVIKTKTGSDTVLVSGMSFVNIAGICYEV